MCLNNYSNSIAQQTRIQPDADCPEAEKETAQIAAQNQQKILQKQERSMLPENTQYHEK